MSRRIAWSIAVIAVVCGAFGCRPSVESDATPSPAAQETRVLSATPTTQPEPTPPPGFAGEINGIEFVGPSQLPAASDFSPKCTGANVRTGTPADAEASDLAFDATYLPAGAQLRQVSVSMCEDVVVLIVREYLVAGGGLIQVVRRRGPAIFASEDAPRILFPALFGGRPSAAGEFIAYMRDELSVFQVILKGVHPRELAPIAEGVRN